MLALVALSGCGEMPPPSDGGPDCCSLEGRVALDVDFDALAEIEGERRGGCLTPELVPAWAGASRLDDFETLSRLVVPLDLSEGRWMKFILDRSAEPNWTYFIHGAHFGPHWEFSRAIGCEHDWVPGRIGGEIGYFAGEAVSAGKPGGFYFSIDAHPVQDYAVVEEVYEELRERIGIAAGVLTYLPKDDEQRAAITLEPERYAAAPFRILEAAPEVDGGIVAMNNGVAFGRLRTMGPREVPSPTDIVVYDALPSDLPMVAGIITTTPQTPLAHVNLRAIQDDIPNTYVPPRLSGPLDPHLDHWVRLEVDGLLFALREASAEEVEIHLEQRRPRETRTPRLDLGVTAIEALETLGFEDAPAFGAKAANVAELRKIGLGALIPDGVAVPLWFYVEFMRATGLADQVRELLSDPRFLAERAYRDQRLRALRKSIRSAAMPAELRDALGVARAGFPSGTSLRCRSSTNVEDLAGFNGAGLYRSYTHHPDEGHLSKSIQQVYASLWTERAYEQRSFYRISHLEAAMGVLIHPNYSDEEVNGVAATDDVLYRWREGIYYVNAQVGEDLITNPDSGSTPEELYLVPESPEGPYFMVHPSSLSPDGSPLMSDGQLALLRSDLESIHEHFRRRYPEDGGPFSMEIEFKITAEGELAIKQARPWVYPRNSTCTCSN